MLTFYIIFQLQVAAAAHADVLYHFAAARCPPLPQMFCLYASTHAALHLQGAAAADADFLHHFHLHGGAVAYAHFLYHFAAARCPPPLQMFWLYASTRAAVRLQGAAAADVDFLQHFFPAAVAAWAAQLLPYLLPHLLLVQLFNRFFTRTICCSSVFRFTCLTAISRTRDVSHAFLCAAAP